jgi:hypothetical protein
VPVNVDTSSSCRSTAREGVDENYYGFDVRNRGRRIATGVRFQVLKIECREPKASAFNTASDTALDLFLHTGADARRGAREATIVPGASVTVQLAWWREDRDVIIPAIDHALDCYEEGCAGAREYKFSVVAFDDRGHFVTAVATYNLLRPCRSIWNSTCMLARIFAVTTGGASARSSDKHASPLAQSIHIQRL